MNELLAVTDGMENEMKLLGILLATIAVALCGLSGFMLMRVESNGTVALWSILLVANMVTAWTVGKTLGKLH